MVENVWEFYGLRENPFSTSPLLVQGGTIPVESFVGRADQLKRLGRIFGSAGGSRTVVYGDVGVGKTSFVNVARRKALDIGFFTPFTEIAVQADWDAYRFVLNTLSGIYSTLKLINNRPVADGTFKKLESLMEIMVEERSIGLTVMGFGGNYGAQRKTPQQIPVATLNDFFRNIIVEINERTKKEVIIHYNNLELLAEESIRDLFSNLRDFLQTPGVHFVVVGNTYVNSVIQSLPRVSSIFNDTPIHIENLGIEEIKEILKGRIEMMRINEELNYIVPYSDDAIEVLYNLYSGNIREILNSLSTAIIEETKDQTVVLNADRLSKTLKSIVETRYLRQLSKRPKEVLSEIIKSGEITNTQLSKSMGMASSNMTGYLKELEKQGCIYVKRQDRKNKYWSAVSQLKWLEIKESDNPIQTNIREWSL